MNIGLHWASLLLLLVPFAAPQQDLDEVLKQADKLLEQAREGYESGKSKASPELLTAAAFKLEEARLKYLAIQELAREERQQTAVNRLKEVQNLAKLLGEARLTLTGKSPAPPPPPPLPPEPAPKETPIPPPPPPAAKTTAAARSDLPAVPDPARQRDAEKAIKETFKAEYARRSPQDTQVLARKFLDLAKETQDDQVVRFVFLREARDLSTQCGDLDTALAAVSVMAQGFQMDLFVAKSAVLAKGSQSARSPEASAALARAYQGFLEEAIAAGQVDAAAGATSKSEAAAKASGDAALAFRALALSKDVAYVQKEAAAVKVSRKTLEEKPEDPAANLALGRFLCFALGDWDKGLPLLSKGSDADLKALAVKDLAQPADAATMTALGDAWWDLFEKDPNATVKRRLRSRSSFWYRQVLPDTTGLVRVRVENRLREPGTWNKPAGKVTRTATVGASGASFEDLSRDNQPLLGFKVIPFTVGNGILIRCIQPIFAEGAGRVDGHTHGNPEGTVQEILAKPGYAVAGVVARGVTRVDGFKVIFMRVAGPLLDPRDSYTSKWIGGTGPGEEVTLGGDGAYVVGIHGRSGADVDCFGLVQIK